MAGYFELPEDHYEAYKPNNYHSSDDWNFAEREEMEHSDLSSIIADKLNKRKPR